MDSRDDHLAILRAMRNEGRISDDEFEELARRHGSVSGDANAPEHTEPTDIDPASDETPRRPGIPQPTLRRDLSGIYLAGLAIAALGFIVAAALDALPWFVSLSAILLLATTLFKGLRLTTIIGAVVISVIVVVGALASSGNGEPIVAQAAPTLAPEDPYPPLPGSLGIYVDQVIEMWNTVDGPPRINQGLTRYNEPTEYDTFLYRFGEWGRVAGAYDPETEAVYALLVTGLFVGEATDQLYLHLCFMVAPYSQECIDSYREKGLEGGSLTDFTDVAHEAEWVLGEHTWRLEIDSNILTVRVYGEDAA